MKNIKNLRNKINFKELIIKIITTILFVCALVCICNNVLFADDVEDWEQLKKELEEQGIYDEDTKPKSGEAADKTYYTKTYQYIVDDDDREDDGEIDKDKTDGEATNVFHDATIKDLNSYHGQQDENGIFNPTSSIGDKVVLKAADPIFTANEGTFCMNSERLSAIASGTANGGWDYLDAEISEVVTNAISIKGRRSGESGWELAEKKKDIDDAFVDGLVGYAVWQWKKGEISPMELQEIIWQSGLIEDSKDTNVKWQYDESLGKYVAVPADTDGSKSNTIGIWQKLQETEVPSNWTWKNLDWKDAELDTLKQDYTTVNNLFNQDAANTINSVTQSGWQWVNYNLGNNNLGFTTEDGNNGIDNEVMENLFNGLWKVENLDTDFAKKLLKRSIQYDECYDKIFNNLKTFYMGDVTYDGVIDINDLKEVVKAYAKKVAGRAIPYKILNASDVNGDGVFDENDVNELEKIVKRQKTPTVINQNGNEYGVLKAEVDTEHAQPLVDQRNKTYIMGPYSADVVFNDSALIEDKGARVETSISWQGVPVYSSTALSVFIKELMGANSGEKARYSLVGDLTGHGSKTDRKHPYSADDSNQFAWFEEDKFKVSIVNSNGEVIESATNSNDTTKNSFVLCDENGDEFTDDAALREAVLQGKNFFVKIKFRDYTMNENQNDYKNYELDYENFAGDFEINIDFGIKYIDQFYVSREIYRYTKDEGGSSIKVEWPEGDEKFSYGTYFNLDTSFKARLLSEYHKYFEEGGEGGGALLNQEMDYYTGDYQKTYKYDVTWDPGDYTMSQSLGGVDNATWYTKKTDTIKTVWLKKKYDANVAINWKCEEDGNPENYTTAGPDYENPVEIPGTATYELVSGPGNDAGRIVTEQWQQGPQFGSDCKKGDYKYGNYKETYIEYVSVDVSSANIIVCENQKIYSENSVDLSAYGLSEDQIKEQIKSVYGCKDVVFGCGSYEYDKDDFLKVPTKDPDIDENPGAKPSDVTGIYIKSWQITKTIKLTSICVIPPSTHTYQSGKTNVTVTSGGGGTTEVDNVLATFTEPSAGARNNIPDSLKTPYKTPAGSYVIDSPDYEWQDFEKILDVRHTTQDIVLNLNIKCTWQRTIKMSINIPIKGISIDIGGKVWIDKEDDKTCIGDMDGVNGKYDKDKDKLYEGIMVHLHEFYYDYKKSSPLPVELNEFVTTTDSEGRYAFIGMDPRSKYYVEFEYNGQIYQSSYYKNSIPYGGGYSNAYETYGPAYSDSINSDKEALNRSSYNHKFETINGDVNISGELTKSNNYNSTSTTNRAYGLNQKIMKSDGSYISVSGDDDGTDYYLYGIYNNDLKNSQNSANGKDGVLTYGDAYNMYRKIVAEAYEKVVPTGHKSIVYRNSKDKWTATNWNNKFNGVVLFYHWNTEDGAHEYLKETEDVYNYIVNTFKNTLKENYGVSQEEADMILNYILDTRIYARTSQDSNLTGEELQYGKDLNQVMYPTRDYFICEDAKDKDDPYKLQYSRKKQRTDSNGQETVEGLKTMYGTYNDKQIDPRYSYTGLDYLYTEGYKYKYSKGNTIIESTNPTKEDCQKYYEKTKTTKDKNGKETTEIVSAGGVDFALCLRTQTDVEIDKDIAKVTMTVNGQELKYTYGQKDMKGWYEVDKEGSALYNGTTVYNRAVRTADYLFNSEEDQKSLGSAEKDLDIFVTYVMLVRNTSNLVTVRVNELADYYDNEGYEVPNYAGSLNKNNIIYENTYYLPASKAMQVSNYATCENVDGQKIEPDSDGKVEGTIAAIQGGRIATEGGLQITDYSNYANHSGILKSEGTVDVDTGYNYSNAAYIRPNGGMVLNPGEYALCYVTYKVKEENGKPKMDKDLFGDGTHTFIGKRNIVEINSYSTYYANAGYDSDRAYMNNESIHQVQNTRYITVPHHLGDNDSKNDVFTRDYAGIVDVDSNPGSLRNIDIYQQNDDNKLIGRIKTNFNNPIENRKEDDTAESPNLQIIFYDDKNEVRSISGMVFDDKRTELTQGAVVGNGKKDSDENGVNGVTVQLVEIITETAKATGKIGDDNASIEEGFATNILGERVVSSKTYGDDEINDPKVIKAVEKSNDQTRYASGMKTEKVIKNINKEDGHFRVNPRSDLEQGMYSFTNIPAGYYYVRFVYGDTDETVLTTNGISRLRELDNNDTNPNQATEHSTDEFNVFMPSTYKGYDGNDYAANSISYNGQDYKSTIYNAGSQVITIGGKTFNAYGTNNEFDNRNGSGDTNIQLYAKDVAEGKEYIKNVGSTDSETSKYQITFTNDNERYSESNYENLGNNYYTFDIANNVAKDDKGNIIRGSDAKDVYAYRQRGNDWANGVTYGFEGDNNELRNYRAEVLSSFERQLTYRNENVAEDVQAQRNAINELQYHTQMVAQTGIMDLTIEIKKDDGTTDENHDRVKAASVSTNGVAESKVYDYEIENVDFGLTERPKAQLKLNKEVANFQFVLQSGKEIVNSNKTQNDLLSFYEHNEHGQTYTNNRLESVTLNSVNNRSLETVAMALDDELLSGSHITITYNLKVTNIGDVDYTDKQFYYTGVEGDAIHNISKTSATAVSDYPTNALRFLETDQVQEDGTSIWKNVQKIKAEIRKADTTVAGSGTTDTTSTSTTETEDTTTDEDTSLVVVKVSDDLLNLLTDGMSEDAITQLKKEIEDNNNSEGNQYGENIDTKSRHTDPSWANDYENRQYVRELETYDYVLITKALAEELIPDNAIDGTDKSAGITVDSITLHSSTNKNLIMKVESGLSNASEDDTYNNLAEIVATHNDNGRRMNFSIVGNQELANQDAGTDAGAGVITNIDRIHVREIDADTAQKVQIRAPTGEDKSYVLLAASIVGAIALIAGAVVVIRKLLK